MRTAVGKSRGGTVSLRFENLNKGLDLNTKAELNQLLCLIADLCDVPIALITFFGKRDQFFLCAAGVDAKKNYIKDSFCQFLNPEDELLEISDARNDIRFKNLAVVTGEANIRFYAGIPLLSKERFVVGSICLFGHIPKQLDSTQRKNFQFLAKQIIKTIDFNRSEENNKAVTAELKLQKVKTEALHQKLRAYFDSSPSLHILLDLKMKVIDFNREAVSIVKKYFKKQIFYEQNIVNYIAADYEAHFRTFFQQALKGKRITREVAILYNGIPVWWRVTLRPVYDENQKIVAVAYSAMNIDESKRNLDKITAQNKSLLEIAVIQSHGYRKPVASILGLINILRNDGGRVDEDVLVMLESAAKELDSHIRAVVKCAE